MLLVFNNIASIVVNEDNCVLGKYGGDKLVSEHIAG
jgi:hypothetical protein